MTFVTPRLARARARSTEGNPIMAHGTRIAVAAAAAALFLAGTVATVAQAQGTLKCAGTNACKGASACKTAGSSCKGMNACKGQGWTPVSTTLECTAKGGRIL